MKLSKFFIPIIAGVTILMMAMPPLPTKAVAALPAVISVPTTDISAIIQRTVIWSWDEAFKVALTAAKRFIIGQMVDQTVEWIQGKGKPKFVTDWNGLLEDAGQAAAGEFTKEIGLGFLCSQFSAQVKISLFPVKKFSKRAECTLDKIIGNINNFRNDFRDGGWIAYSTSWQPQNNIFGATLMAANELERRKEAASGASWSEALAGKGFLSTKECKADEKTGKIIESTCKITTPGDVIGNMTAKAVGADFDFIVNATDIKEIIAAIADAFINRMVTEGVKGLTGVNPPDNIDAGYVDLGKDPCAKLAGVALEACQKYRLAQGRNFEFSQSGIIQEINFTLQPNISAKNTILSSIEILQSYVDWAKLAYETLSGLQYISICKGPNGSESIVKTELIKNIKTSIDQENKLIDRLKTDQGYNQRLIDELQNAQDKIAALSSTETEKMISIFDAISDKLDATSAENFNSSLAAENTEIYNRTKANLSQFDKQVKTCQASK